MPKYQNPSMQKFYDTLLTLAKDKSSELYYNGAQHRGASHRCAFWDGFDGLQKSANVIPGTISAAAFAAGKEYAKRLKKRGTTPPEKAATPYFSGRQSGDTKDPVADQPVGSPDVGNEPAVSAEQTSVTVRNPFKDPSMRKEFDAAMKGFLTKHRDFFLPDGSRRTMSGSFNQNFWAGFDGLTGGIYQWDAATKKKLAYCYYRAGQEAKKLTTKNLAPA